MVGRRSRTAGLSFDDRQDMLGHRSGRITMHRSGAEPVNPIDAANKVRGENSGKIPALECVSDVQGIIGKGAAQAFERAPEVPS